MNRHLRNLVYFLLGFVGICLAGLASAGWYVDDGYSHSGGNLNRSAHGNAAAGSGASATVNGSIVEVNRSWSQAMGDAATGAAAQAAVNVWSKIPKSGVVNAARSLTLPGLATTIATQWLFDQGWQQLQDQWQKEDSSDFGGLYNCVKAGGVWVPYADVYTAATQCYGAHSWTRNVKGFPGKLYYKDGSQPEYNVSMWYKSGSTSYQTATPEQITFEMERLVDNRTVELLRELALRNIELTGAVQTIAQLGDALSPKTPVESSSQTNPDGSTTTTQKEQQQKFEISTDELPAESPVPVKQSTVTTTTTNVYNTNNTVTTTTNTTTTNNNPGGGAPQQEQKSQCELTPNALGCAEIGDAPTAPDLGTDTVTLSFSWTPFSMPAQCPQPVQVNTYLIPSFTIPYDSLCTAADIARPLIIAGAFLMALGIIFGGPSND